ncbi:MAG: hypothetical protein HDS75_07390 [Bacteroidales bacterium]|nr:hypothetical protein [Bacteroidales bacterium]
MPADLQQITSKLTTISSRLNERVRELIVERDDARRQVADRDATIREQQREIERLTQQVDFLTVVSTALPAPGDIEKSRAILSGLVREIDKCIKDLTE